ncbi:MAG: lytic transglycosylase domain-containing protein [Oxalobacter sp.]|nr:MAG: lytic transglycosylase domain-containing protein [Oxalobacter sp.]
MQIGVPRSSRIMAALRQVVLVAGITAICMLGVMFARPNLADEILALSPYSTRVVDETIEGESQWRRLVRVVSQSSSVNHALVSVNAVSTESAEDFDPVEKTRVTQWLAKRYRVANDAADSLVSEAYAAAAETHQDPLLILSVIAIESRFNPIAESPVGAKGLMQVMATLHSEKFDDHGGVQAALNPAANIRVGAQILKEYVRRGGSLEAGLKSYVGAAMHRTDGGYGAKVLSEYHRLKLVARGKQVPITASAIIAQAKSPVADDEEVGTVELAAQEEAVASTDESTIKKSM